MLPDWPLLKTEIVDSLQRYMRRRAKAASPLIDSIGKVAIHQGDSTHLIRLDSSEEQSALKKAEATITIGMDELPKLTCAELLKRLDEPIEQIVRAQTKHLFATLEEAVAKTGNKV